VRQTLRQTLTSPVRPSCSARAQAVVVAVPDDTPERDQLAARLTETLERYGLLRPPVAGLRSVLCVTDTEWQGNAKGLAITVGPDLLALDLDQYDALLRTITNLVWACVTAHRWQSRPTASPAT
jgi:hypothetical protein